MAACCPAAERSQYGDDDWGSAVASHVWSPLRGVNLLAVRRLLSQAGVTFSQDCPSEAAAVQLIYRRRMRRQWAIAMAVSECEVQSSHYKQWWRGIGDKKRPGQKRKVPL